MSDSPVLQSLVWLIGFVILDRLAVSLNFHSSVSGLILLTLPIKVWWNKQGIYGRGPGPNYPDMFYLRAIKHFVPHIYLLLYVFMCKGMKLDSIGFQYTINHVGAFLVFQWQRICLRYWRGRRLRFNPWVKKISWRRKQQPTPVFLLEKLHGQRTLVGYSL